MDIFTREEAIALLRAGARRGLVSEQRVEQLPQNIWSVTDAGEPVEAQLENSGLATYHGYPLPTADPFRDVVLQRWRETEPASD